MRDDPGWVYLIHLDRPLGNQGNGGRNSAQHRWGHAKPGGFIHRMEEHCTEPRWPQGNAAAMLAAARDRGIDWHVADMFPGSYADEQKAQRRGHTKDRCPTCITDRNHQPELEAGA
jgi:hypothetical protein